MTRNKNGNENRKTKSKNKIENEIENAYTRGAGGLSNRGEDAESLGKNEGFFSRVSKSNFEKTLVSLLRHRPCMPRQRVAADFFFFLRLLTPRNVIFGDLSKTLAR